MTKAFLSALLAILLVNAKAQFSENFNDGDFTANPSWIGNTADFTVNTSFQLQSNNTVANSAFYLSTSNTLATQAQWEFYTQLAFSTSGANYVDVYLTASQSDLTQTATTGYFVRLGNTDDEVSLYRKDANGTSVKIIDGVNASIAGSNNILKVKVIRNAANQWTLYRDVSGTGTNYFSEGTVTDATHLSSAFFGFLVRQSTASFFQRHFFDDVLVSNYVPDVTPPALVAATPTTVNTVTVLFNEPVSAATAENANNYTLSVLGKPASATIIPGNPLAVLLTFAAGFISGTSYTLTVTGISDLAGNILNNGSANFTWFVPGRFSIVIDEIMADPTPQVGLPNAEWIELKNTTPVAINLQNFRIGKPGSISGPMPSFLLQPDSFVVVTTASQVPALAAFGRTISVTSFPSLGNESDLIFLQTNTGDIMHVINYDISWYQNGLKADGGWTLEMIDPKNACAGLTNWKASTDNTGGTPGKRNSVNATNPDSGSPSLLRAFASDSVTISLFFDEPLDSAKGASPAAYSVSDGVATPKTAIPQGPLFTKVVLTLNTPLVRGKVYTVTVSTITDCSGNIMGSRNTAKLGLSSPVAANDLIVNEILFNPKDFGVDYVELYNRSSKIIDLSGISLANRSSTTGNLATPVKIITDNYLLFPGEFIALTTDPIIVKQQYNAKNPDAFIIMALPSFPDTRGFVVVLNNQGNIVDELDYINKWHFALLDSEQGVSLERVDYNQPTSVASNWASAAASAGFGTPGYVNSQYRSDLLPKGEITINPKIFSPDNDGFEDFAFINFSFPEPGYVVNITIYDAAGRPVKTLQRNTTAAATGVFRWDGLDDKLQRVPVGTYIIYTDIFNLQGRKKQFKNTVVVARKF